MAIFHVAKQGADHAAGTEELPLRTINEAGRRVLPGDMILVHGGVYREWVNPVRSGASDAQRVTIAAAEGEKVVVKGSEQVTDWSCRDDGLWQCYLPDEWFKGTNTLRAELFGDWFWHENLPQHLGELFCGGDPLFEVENVDKIKLAEPWPKALPPDHVKGAWCAVTGEQGCEVVADFGDEDPNATLVELSVREACLYPKANGVDWVTIRGIEFCQAASPWAPPTAEQVGMVGPNWAKGWIIEDCHLHHARCSGISLGAPSFIGNNRWTRERVKHGTQREREAVFTALSHGWSAENIGSHIVRRNHIHHCEQTGICGHLGAIFSELSENHIHHIHVRRRFSGHEMAGIKLHAPIDCLITRNRLHHCIMGLWMDWQAQGTRISRNLCHDNSNADVYIEVSHGPYTVDNNLLLSTHSVKNCSQGGAFVGNLITGSILMQRIGNRFTFYHYPHSTAIAGLMTILGGDDRWMGNLFLGGDSTSVSRAAVGDENAKIAKREDYGTSIYDGFPKPASDWCSVKSVDAYASLSLPVAICKNAYANDAKPWEAEETIATLGKVGFVLNESATGVELLSDFSESGSPMIEAIDWGDLGQSFQAETPFSDCAHGNFGLMHDYYGKSRDSSTATGPFAVAAAKGRSTRIVWPPSKIG